MPRLRRTGLKTLDILFDNSEFEPIRGCWLWKYAKAGKGYTQIYHNRKNHMGHRLAYMLLRGSIPDNLHIDHLCRIRHCLNPWHLEAVTPRENIVRGESIFGMNARKNYCHNDHPLAGDNLRINPRGERKCRACDRIKALKKYHLRKARIAGATA